ncbi:DUF1616 domain-containing protein [Chloroflexota bacterium]
MEWLSPIRQIFDFTLPLLERLPTVRAILGFILVFFLPGFVWTLVLFKQVNIIERIALSFGLSIALVTLSILVLNVLLGIKINTFNSLLIIIVITIIPLGLYYLERFAKGRPSGED